MGAAGNISAPGGLTQTAAGKSQRPKGRGAVEGKGETRLVSAVSSARRRLGKARTLIGAIAAVATRVAVETERGEKTGLAIAGRFVHRGGCGCELE